MTWRKGLFNVSGAVALGCLVASSAQAIPITTSGAWDSADANAATTPTVSIGNDGTGMNNKISWGTPADGAPSSWVFTGASISPSLSDVLAGVPQPLGVFTHNNFVITAATAGFFGADLRLNILVDLDGDTINEIDVNFGPFGFDHEETPNSGDPLNCDPVGLGMTACPDVVDIPTALEGIPFTFMGMNFEFFLAGFQPSGGGAITTQFVTEEGLVNNATLFGQVRKVPEPTTPLLLGLGLLGLGVIRKRKKQ